MLISHMPNVHILSIIFWGETRNTETRTHSARRRFESVEKSLKFDKLHVNVCGRKYFEIKLFGARIRLNFENSSFFDGIKCSRLSNKPQMNFATSTLLPSSTFYFLQRGVCSSILDAASKHV